MSPSKPLLAYRTCWWALCPKGRISLSNVSLTDSWILLKLSMDDEYWANLCILSYQYIAARFTALDFAKTAWWGEICITLKTMSSIPTFLLYSLIVLLTVFLKYYTQNWAKHRRKLCSLISQKSKSWSSVIIFIIIRQNQSHIFLTLTFKSIKRKLPWTCLSVITCVISQDMNIYKNSSLKMPVSFQLHYQPLYWNTDISVPVNQVPAAASEQ